jgi:DNA-binding LacI/PurR family transcriptional regulator
VKQTISSPDGDRGLTIAAVARLAAVSPATVSRVLNGDPRVGAEYRDRVTAAVAELGYRPNRLARNLRKQRTAAIGVVISDIENPHFSEAVRAIEDLAFKRGHPVLVCNTDETPEKERAYLEMMMDERVLGVILSPSSPSEPAIAEVVDSGIPIVAFDREVEDPRADAVLADNIRGARMATERLIAAGHRDVAFVGGRREVETGAERLDGYEIAMRRAGLEPRSIDGGFRTQVAHDAVVALLRSEAPPTALVVANNLMTLGTLGALRQVGAAVPGDVGLVGIDDPPWAALVAPALTTIGQPVRRMATDAMELLLERVAGREHSRRIVHPMELHARDSDGVGSR